MNMISVATNTLQMTATNKAIMAVAVLGLAAICIVKLVTSPRFLSMLVGVILLVAAVVVFAGCAPVDPRRAAEATERTTNASVAANQANAQIAQAQGKDEEARRAQERLQALQAQQAIVQGQAAIAQAQSQTDIAAINSAALVNVAAQMAAAAKPDYTPVFILLFAAIVGLVAWQVFASGRSLSTPRQLRGRAGHDAWLLPNGTIRVRRLRDDAVFTIAPTDPLYSRLITDKSA